MHAGKFAQPSRANAAHEDDVPIASWAFKHAVQASLAGIDWQASFAHAVAHGAPSMQPQSLARYEKSIVAAAWCAFSQHVMHVAGSLAHIASEPPPEPAAPDEEPPLPASLDPAAPPLPASLDPAEPPLPAEDDVPAFEPLLPPAVAAPAFEPALPPIDDEPALAPEAPDVPPSLDAGASLELEPHAATTTKGTTRDARRTARRITERR